ncbi:unnamed protein product [Boreogadus saida]
MPEMNPLRGQTNILTLLSAAWMNRAYVQRDGSEVSCSCCRHPPGLIKGGRRKAGSGDVKKIGFADLANNLIWLEKMLLTYVPIQL